MFVVKGLSEICLYSVSQYFIGHSLSLFVEFLGLLFSFSVLSSPGMEAILFLYSEFESSLLFQLFQKHFKGYYLQFSFQHQRNFVNIPASGLYLLGRLLVIILINSFFMGQFQLLMFTWLNICGLDESRLQSISFRFF